MAASLGNYVAWSSTGSLASLLKEFYLGPVQNQLNDEMMVLQLFEKATVDWNGRLCMIPIHTGRNVSTQFLGEGEAFFAPGAVAGQQQWKHLTVRAHFLYGHFQISGPAIASAKAGGKGAFIGWMEAEMTRLVEDVKNLADQTLISGGSCVGFLHAADAPGAPAVWSFDGDYGKLRAAITAGMTQVAITRMDQPGFQSDGVTPINTYFLDQVSAGIVVTGGLAGLNETAGTLSLGNVNTTTSAGAVPPVNAGGFGFPVYLTNAGAGNLLDASATQPRGLFANMTERSPFGVDKGGADATPAPPTAANATPACQPIVLTCDPTPTGATATRAPLSTERMQQVFDEVSVLSGKDPNIILCHPTMRAQYVALMADTGNLYTDTRGGATKGDAGFLDLSFANVPLKYGRHVPRGLMVYLETKTWKVAELQSGAFADLDGSSLHRTGTSDEWNGYYRWYYNLVCVQPNANAILCGINYPA